MMRILFLGFVILNSFRLNSQNSGIGALPPFTKWYQNPLGINPINLQTSNGILLPGIAATALLVFTKRDSTLKDRLSVYTNIGYSKGYYASKTNVYQNEIGFMFKVRSYLSLGAEITSINVQDDVNNTWGFGIRPNVRFNILSRESFTLYAQSGAGLIYFMDEFPQPSGFFGDNRKGTHFNGSPKYGIGTEVKINKKLNFNIGLWHIHFSNGNYYGTENNPGHDSNGLSLGLSF